MDNSIEILALAATQRSIQNERLLSSGELSRLICAIYSALSDRDSLDIFCLAAAGIPAKTRILAEHKFSRKRYYVRLKRLINAGLVWKVGKHYVHTSLGQMIYENEIMLMRHLISLREEIVGVQTCFAKSAFDSDLAASSLR